MPGPNSAPSARTPQGVVIAGKTAIRRAGLKSGQGFDYGRDRAERQRDAEKK